MSSDTNNLHKRAKPLIQRINLQQEYGTKDLTEWLLELANPQPTDKIVDIGCGSGNHLLPFAKKCAVGIGVDVSEELLDSLNRDAKSSGIKNITSRLVSGDELDLGEERYEIVMCNFAIYYMDASEVIRRMSRHLTANGTAYVMGSPDENARELMEIHAQATDMIPPTYAPGYSDIRKYQPVMEQHFTACVFHQFVNPVNFPSSDHFLEYYLSTNLFQQCSSSDSKLESKVAEVSKRRYQDYGKITITKVVETAQLMGPIERD